jgi:hypothetical protein
MFEDTANITQSRGAAGKYETTFKSNLTYVLLSFSWHHITRLYNMTIPPNYGNLDIFEQVSEGEFCIKMGYYLRLYRYCV